MVDPNIFGQVKRKCNITWDDDETKSRLEEIIENAIPDLLDRLGIADPDFDFSIPGKENKLLVNYCFYEWNHCSNEFADNYADDIAQIRAKNEVAQYLQSEENNDAEE